MECYVSCCSYQWKLSNWIREHLIIFSLPEAVKPSQRRTESLCVLCVHVYFCLELWNMFPCSLNKFKEEVFPPNRSILVWSTNMKQILNSAANNQNSHLYHDVKHRRIIKEVFCQQNMIFIHPWSTKSFILSRSFLPSCDFRNHVSEPVLSKWILSHKLLFQFTT